MIIEYTPIGIIHSPFTKTKGMPIQPAGGEGIAGTVEIYRDFEKGLKDLDGFSHIILLYHFHKSKDYKLEVVPFLDSISHGIFSTRAPARPNHIGLSIVRLIKIENNILHIENIDIIDSTPLIDIKPYIPEFDQQSESRAGWFENINNKAKDIKSDAFDV